MRNQLFIFTLLAGAATSSVAGAASLVPGGYLLAPMDNGSAAVDSDWSLGDFSASTQGSDLKIGFTPRGGGSVLLGERDPRGAGVKGLGLGMGENTGSLSLVDGRASTMSAAQRANLQAASPLSIGGAVTWSDWTIGGTYARGQFIGGATDLVGASIGFGPVTARFGYGVDSTARVRDGRELFVVGTDLAASSWLTLEGDLALSTTQRTVEPTTVGRVGIRLNF